MVSAEELLSQLKEVPGEAQPSSIRDALLQSVQKFQLCVRDGNFPQLEKLGIALVSTSTALGTASPEAFDREQAIAGMAILGRLALRFIENVAPRQEALRELEMTPPARMVLAVIAEGDRIQAAALRRELQSRYHVKTNQSNLGRHIKKLSDARLIVVYRRKRIPWYEVTDDGRRVAATLNKRRLHIVASGPGRSRPGVVLNICETLDIRAKEA